MEIHRIRSYQTNANITANITLCYITYLPYDTDKSFRQDNLYRNFHTRCILLRHQPKFSTLHIVIAGGCAGLPAVPTPRFESYTQTIQVYQIFLYVLVCSCSNESIKLAQVIITTEVCPHQNHHLNQSQSDSRESKIKRMKFVRVITSLITDKERRQLFNNDIQQP